MVFSFPLKYITLIDFQILSHKFQGICTPETNSPWPCFLFFTYIATYFHSLVLQLCKTPLKYRLYLLISPYGWLISYLQYILNQYSWKSFGNQEWLLTAVTPFLWLKPECPCPVAMSFLTSQDSSTCYGSSRIFKHSFQKTQLYISSLNWK